MTVDEAAERLEQLLVEAGFDAVRPVPRLAWQAFTQFAAEPVDVETTELWFEADDGDSARDYPAYFDFVRMFTHYPDDDAVWDEQITARFTAPPITRVVGVDAYPLAEAFKISGGETKILGDVIHRPIDN